MNRERGGAVVLEFPDKRKDAIRQCATAHVHLQVFLRLYEVPEEGVTTNEITGRLTDALHRCFDHVQALWKVYLTLDPLDEDDSELIHDILEVTVHRLHKMVKASIYLKEYDIGLASVEMFATQGIPCIYSYIELLNDAYINQDNLAVQRVWASLETHIEILTEDLLSEQQIFSSESSSQMEYRAPIEILVGVLETHMDMSRKNELANLLQRLAAAAR